MNWLDNYIFKNDGGYLINAEGGIFVDVGNDYVRWVKGDKDPIDLKAIEKDEFISRLMS